MPLLDAESVPRLQAAVEAAATLFSRDSTVSVSTGLVRWWLKPASNARRRSLSCPQPVMAMRGTSRAPTGRANAPRNLVSRDVRQADVEQDRPAGGYCCQDLERLGTAVRVLDLVARQLEHGLCSCRQRRDCRRRRVDGVRYPPNVRRAVRLRRQIVCMKSHLARGRRTTNSLPRPTPSLRAITWPP